MMGMLIGAYAINLVTTFSLSAIASNGTVRGGGAYYLISRSLGPEFGGSIGVVFYLGVAFNTGMNAVGLIDCIILNFGSTSGNWAQVLPDTFWHLYLWATIVLVLCTAIGFAGSSMFARASNWLLVILLVSTLSIPLSALFMPPFESRKLGIEYTGLSLETLVGNLQPQLTRGSAGGQLHGKETFQDLFGILFPATGGIFAGASMSGDLRKPSKSIPKGTLYGLATTFVLYTLVILAMAATITRASFTRNTNVIQDTNISGILILAGEVASCLFSTLMGIIGSAKLLQALARDNLLPGFSIFGQGTKKGDEPTYAIIMTVIVAQITILGDLNKIASFVTMTYLVRNRQQSYRCLFILYIQVNQHTDRYLDDLSCHESCLFFSENKLGSKLSSFFPFLQLADRSAWDHCIRSCNVLRRWPVCCRLCGHPNYYLPHNTLYKPAEELGRRFSEPHLPPSSQISPAAQARTCQVLAPTNTSVC